MNEALKNLYRPNTVNEKRLKTDRLFIDDGVVCDYHGRLDRTMRYLERVQLLDPPLWARFVEQFRVQEDHTNYGWRGEFWGKMMRGASFVYRYTRNPDLFRVLRDSVEDMMTAAEPSGRISSYAANHEFCGWDVWCRKYVLLGMQYFMEICPDEDLNRRLIASMEGQVAYIMSKVGPKAEGKIPITYTAGVWRGLASTSLLEPIVRLYDLTRKQEYLDFAGYIVSEGGTSIADIFQIAYEDKTDPYQYPITKAYEMISCFEGLLEYYRATGIEKYRVTVENFARRLAKTDISIIGTAGCTHEYFDHATARQTDTAYQGIMQETCVTVTWMKFCMQMLALTGDPQYADCFETALYNAYLGAVNTEEKVDTTVLKSHPDAILRVLPFDSYASLLPNTRGRGIGGLQKMADKHYYGCCVCIGSAGIGMTEKVAVMLSRTGVAVNLFVDGTTKTVAPSGRPLTIEIATGYPADGAVRLTLHPTAPEAFDLAVRVPAWSRRTTVAVCGEPVAVTAGYTVISRTWQDGDTVELTLDMRTEALRPVSNPRDLIIVDINWANNYVVPRVVEESPDAPYHVALRRGPLILARDARLGEDVDAPVDVLTDADGFVDVAACAAPAFDHEVAFAVPTADGGHFTVVDYASAGKTLDEASRFACWLPTR